MLRDVSCVSSDHVSRHIDDKMFENTYSSKKIMPGTGVFVVRVMIYMRQILARSCALWYMLM